MLAYMINNTASNETMAEDLDSSASPSINSQSYSYSRLNSDDHHCEGDGNNEGRSGASVESDSVSQIAADQDVSSNLAKTSNQIRFSAMSLLARREHSRFELKQKLSLRFGATALIETVIQQLADEALQSDERFAEAFVAMRVRKGQGPVRIKLELEQRRVSEDLIDEKLATYKNEWQTIALSVCQKKYKRLAKESSERAKQIRFLQYRGFTSEQVHSLWK